MLSVKTKNNLAEMLLCLGECYIQLDSIKLILGNQSKFIIEHVFRRLYDEELKTITESSFHNFLEECSVYATEDEVSTFFNIHSNLRTNELDLSRITDFLLPKRNEKLRLKIMERSLTKKSMRGFLNYEVEYSISRLFECEFNLIRKMRDKVKVLTKNRDFKIVDCFHEIDMFTSGRISHKSLKKFMHSTVYCSDDIIISKIIERISGLNSSIGITEFYDLFDLYEYDPSKNYVAAKHIEENETRSNSKYMHCMKAVTTLGGSTSSSSSSRLKFPLNTESNTNVKMVDLTELIKFKETQRRKKDYIKIQQMKKIKMRTAVVKKANPGMIQEQLVDRRSFKRKKRLVKNFNHDSVKLSNHHSKESIQLKEELLRTLKKMWELEKEVEDLRQDLVLRPDFVVAQLFSYFDVGNKAQVSLLEVQNGLMDMGITPNKEDLAITLKEFDRRSRGVLDYEDVFRMVAPQNKQFKDILVQRHKRTVPANFEESISDETYLVFKTWIETIVEITSAYEALRQRLINKKGMDSVQAFNSLDFDGDGKISAKDLKRCCDIANVALSKQQISFLMKRFDLDQDKRWNFSDFMRMITPLSGLKY